MNNHPAINEILSRLDGQPGLPVVRVDNSLSIEPENSSGFRVELRDYSTKFLVYLDGWHTDQFNTYEDAAKCFLFGLTAAARLLVKQRGRWRYWWNFETFADGVWAGIEITVLLFFPFWRRKKVYYLQNDWIDIEKLKPWMGEQFTANKIVLKNCVSCGKKTSVEFNFCANCGEIPE